MLARQCTTLGVAAAAALLGGCGGGGDDHPAVGCGPASPAHVRVYEARASGSASVTPARVDAMVGVLCRRARPLGPGKVSVRRKGATRVEVGSEDVDLFPVLPVLAAPAHLRFYDWEPNLTPGTQAHPAPKPPRPVRSGIVALRDPAGGYWTLRDRPTLTGADVVHPRQSIDETTGLPNVTFGFTPRGRRAFARMTRREADRGERIRVSRGTPTRQAFQRFAIALDGRIVSLATVDYFQNPKGISGSTGAQLDGLSTIAGTRALAGTLAGGPLPLGLVLAR